MHYYCQSVLNRYDITYRSLRQNYSLYYYYLHLSATSYFVSYRAAEAGILEQVTLENFLCHRFLEVSFGPNVNFLHGANGSSFAWIAHSFMVELLK